MKKRKLLQKHITTLILFTSIVGCNISSSIPQQINIPTLLAIQPEGSGHLLSASLQNFENGFIGYRLLQSNSEISTQFIATNNCPAAQTTCSNTCCDCTNLNKNPNPAATFVFEVLNNSTLRNLAHICPFATLLQSGFQIALYAIIRNTNQTYSFSRRSNVLTVPQ